MSEQNKPQWLIDAEKELTKFNDSKYANMTDGQIAKSIATIDNFKLKDSEVQSKRGIKGGSTTATKRKAEGYFQSEKWKEAQRKGAKTSGDQNVESGHWDNIKGLGTPASHEHITCPVCSYTGSTTNVKRSHFDKCIYPIIKDNIESCLPEEEEFSITLLINELKKKTGLTDQPIRVALKRFFLVPGIKPSRYAKWRYQPLKDGEDIRGPFD